METRALDGGADNFPRRYSHHMGVSSYASTRIYLIYTPMRAYVGQQAFNRCATIVMFFSLSYDFKCRPFRCLVLYDA